MTRLLLLASSLALALTAACNGRHVTSDGTLPDAAIPMDASADAALVDGATHDLGMPDGGHDAAVLDASSSDAGHDAGPASDGSTCSIVGDYSLTFMGTTVYLRFTATGTFAVASDRAGLDTSTMMGTYTFSGGMIVLNDADTSCAITDDGDYTVAFDASCGFTLTLVSDACAPRGASLGGQHFVRLP